ncbi:MAG: flagellar assembly protein FliW [Desulfocapsaceae bacterium]|nr:flagellar assembly protein FliW [Desulfocapsaceae bacterium]
MSKILTRFGEVEYDEKNLLTFPAGMIGFPTLRSFIVMPNRKEGPLFWIQSVDDPAIAFVLTDPNNFFLEYNVQPDESVRQILHLEDDDPCYVLTVVTVPPDQHITINLAAPIFFTPHANRALQVILENSSHQVKTPLPKISKD